MSKYQEENVVLVCCNVCMKSINTCKDIHAVAIIDFGFSTRNYPGLLRSPLGSSKELR